MARVTMAESEQLASQLKGLRIFKPEIDVTFRYLIPTERADGEDTGVIIMYANAIHEVKLGQTGGNVRCIKGYERRLANGELETDPVTGKPVNDGSCPYCDLGIVFSKYIATKKAEHDEKYPNATDSEKKEFGRKIASTSPAKKGSMMRGFLVARLQTDRTGQKLEINSETGLPMFEIGLLPIKDNQYTVKFKSAITQYDNDPAWAELLFSYPTAENIMTAAKDMGIQPVIKQTLDKYPDLKEAIWNSLGQFDLNSIEDKIYYFRPETIPVIERKIAAKQSELLGQLTEEQREEVKLRLEGKVINAEAATLDDIANFDKENEAGPDESIDVEIDGNENEGLI